MDKWKEQIQTLKERDCHWRSGSLEDAKQITHLAQEIASDPDLEEHEMEWLIECIKSGLGAPKGVLRGVIQAATAKAFPHPPVPDGCIEATEQPIDLQIAQRILSERNYLVAERAWSLFRYAEDLGFWCIWPDTTAKKEAQDLAQIFALETKEGWCFPYGSSAQVKAAVEQLKVMTTNGTLASDDPPPVIVFRNGTFNLKGKELEAHNPANAATYGVAANYIEAAECPKELERVISTCYPQWLP